MQNDCSRQRLEAEVAAGVEGLMRLEYGLSPAGTLAELHGDRLQVRLGGAVSPLGRVIAQEEGGEEILESVYGIFDDINRKKVDAVVSGIVGRSVQHSSLQPDAETGNILIVFHLGEPLTRVAGTKI